jgi:cytochrome c biogenesis protein CcmG/thiol:disulfide interchange protein DsbE
MIRRWQWSLLAATALALAACSSTSTAGSSHAPAHLSAERLRLIKSAGLAPCPTSSAAGVSGGLPNLTLDCLGTGPAVHLAGLAGPAVVNVWGSWCGPCQQEAGYLSEVYDADRGKVTFLGIDTEDDPNSALDFGTHVTPPVRYPSVVDPDRKVLIALAKAPGPPETAFIGTSGRVVYIHLGGYDSAAQLRADISRYLGVT